MSLDLRLVAILDPAVLGDRDPVAAARAAAAGGATQIQLRAKALGAAACCRLAARLVAASPVPVWVNDRADVARAAGGAGVHVGQDDLAPALVRVIAPAPFAIGVSVGSPEEAAAVAGAPAAYWSIGPCYPTASKPDAGPALGPDGFARLARLAPPGMPVLGIGGITATNAGAVCAAGAAGVAVIGAIFAAADIEAAARALRAAVDAARPG